MNSITNQKYIFAQHHGFSLEQLEIHGGFVFYEFFHGCG